MHTVRAWAPGRVNLIGEHTDYNGGLVLPCAIAYGTSVTAFATSDRTITVHSHDRIARFDATALPTQPQNAWSDYVWGILAELQKEGMQLCGAGVNVDGDVPTGAGLSSSASFEIAFAMAMIALAGQSMLPLDLALLAQRAETSYVGTRCGIMDQIAVLYGKAEHAIFLDTHSLNFEFVALPAEAAVVICNTMVKHALSQHGYNDRRSECEQALRLLQKQGIAAGSLSDIDMACLENVKQTLPPTLFARCRHVVTENERVREAVRALRGPDLQEMGTLMYASHESLRADYQVSSPELDFMVECAKGFTGTIGSRMTGGGFGGCTVSLVHATQSKAFRAHMQRAYFAEAGVMPEIYDGTPSAGARVWND